MYYVYIIQSLNFPSKIYVDFSENLKNRLAEHNKGDSFYTKNSNHGKYFFIAHFMKRKRLWILKSI